MDDYDVCKHHQNAFVLRRCSNRKPCKQNECSNRYPCLEGQYLMPDKCRCRRGVPREPNHGFAFRIPASPPHAPAPRASESQDDSEEDEIIYDNITRQIQILRDGLDAVAMVLEHQRARKRRRQ